MYMLFEKIHYRVSQRRLGDRGPVVNAIANFERLI